MYHISNLQPKISKFWVIPGWITFFYWIGSFHTTSHSWDNNFLKFEHKMLTLWKKKCAKSQVIWAKFGWVMMYLAKSILDLPLNRFLILFSFEYFELALFYSYIAISGGLYTVLGNIWMYFVGNILLHYCWYNTSKYAPFQKRTCQKFILRHQIYWRIKLKKSQRDLGKIWMSFDVFSKCHPRFAPS